MQYNLQTDMARRQLEYEAQQVQGAMTDKLGSTEQSSQRQEARLRRIRTIESEMIQLQRQQQMTQRVSGCARGGGGWKGVCFMYDGRGKVNEGRSDGREREGKERERESERERD